MFVLVGASLVVVALLVGLSYQLGHRAGHPSGPVAVGGPRPHLPHTSRLSLVTEALAYVGAILVLSGGGIAVEQRWDDLGPWGRVAVYAVASALFLTVGLLVRRSPDPAFRRLAGVAWLLAVPTFGGAVGLLLHGVYDRGEEITTVLAGGAAAAYGAALWQVHRHALQQVAVFGALIVTTCGTIVAIATGPAPTLAFALALWTLGVAWAVLGWRGYLVPPWLAMALGALLALFAPSVAVGDHGWVYAIGIGTAAFVMGISVPRHDPRPLVPGTLAMFGYVTAVSVRYLHDSLGVPAALMVTGVAVLVLAVVVARLTRAASRRPPEEPPERPVGG